MKKEDIFYRLFDVAKSAPRVCLKRSRIAAAIVYKNEVISLETNVRKTHPFQKTYGKNEGSIFLHAETHAVMKALKKISVDDMKDASIYIVRARMSPDRKWCTGMSKPCSGCERCLATFGINNVYYTENDSSVFSCL